MNEKNEFSEGGYKIDKATMESGGNWHLNAPAGVSKARFKTVDWK